MLTKDEIQQLQYIVNAFANTNNVTMIDPALDNLKNKLKAMFEEV